MLELEEKPESFGEEVIWDIAYFMRSKNILSKLEVHKVEIHKFPKGHCGGNPYQFKKQDISKFLK